MGRDGNVFGARSCHCIFQLRMGLRDRWKILEIMPWKRSWSDLVQDSSLWLVNHLELNVFFRFINYVSKVTILLMLIYGWFWWNGDMIHTDVGGLNRNWHEAKFMPPKYAMKVLTESNIHVLRLKFIVHCLFKVWPLICPSKLRHSDW